MSGNANFNMLATTTLNRWCQKNFADAFSGHNPVFYKLRQNGNIVSGGLGIKALEPVIFADASYGFAPAGVSDPYQPLDPQENRGWTNAEFTWSEHVLSVTLPKLIMDQQGSETRKIEYLSNYKDLAMKAFMEYLANQMFRAEGAAGSNGTSRQYLGSLRTYLNRGGTLTTAPSSTNAGATLTSQIYNGGVDPGGIAVGTSPLTIVGNIERNDAGQGWWCTPVRNPGSADTMDLTNLQLLITEATRGNDYPDLIIMTRRNFATVAGTLQSYQRFEPGKLADAGFRSFRYDGCDVVFDDRCPDKNIFVLNTKYLKLRSASMNPEFEFLPDPYRPILNWQARWCGQLTSGNLGRVHARHNNIGSA